MKAATILASLCITLLWLAGDARGAESRLSVLPIFFVPVDSSLSHQNARNHSKLLMRHLRLAQQHYRALLKSDTFTIARGEPRIYRAAEPASFYATQKGSDQPDSAHRILKELFEWNHDNRMDSRYIYLVIFVRNHGASFTEDTLGGGRTFNGPPGSGGGIVQLEFASLKEDKPYPFQSTLVHELGHAFGLVHVDCHGYDMAYNDSIMSYRIAHHSKGLIPSKTPGEILNPEEFYTLSLNRLAFPDFRYDPELHNPTGKSLKDIAPCFLGSMENSIGEFRRVAGRGFELLINGRLRSRPEAAYYTKEQAESSCRWNHEHNGKQYRVECRYDGKPFEPLR